MGTPLEQRRTSRPARRRLRASSITRPRSCAASRGAGLTPTTATKRSSERSRPVRLESHEPSMSKASPRTSSSSRERVTSMRCQSWLPFGRDVRVRPSQSWRVEPSSCSQPPRRTTRSRRDSATQTPSHSVWPSSRSGRTHAWDPRPTTGSRIVRTTATGPQRACSLRFSTTWRMRGRAFAG